METDRMAMANGLCALLALCAAAGAAEPALTFVVGDDPLRPAVVARLSPAAAQALPASAVEDSWLRLARLEGGQPQPDMFGTLRREAERLVLMPAARLAPGAQYRATLALPGAAAITLDYTAPVRPPAEPAVVERIYPSSGMVPANILKFYVYFSRPMRDTETIFDYLQILNADGQPVADPWRRQSLWTDDGRRQTLLIHPGRIKRGVNLREELGPVLRPEQTYTLVIGREALAADGQPLGRRYEKRFRTLPEDHERPSLEKWRLTAPRAGGTAPLVVNFNEPLDHALARRLLNVLDARGERVLGTGELSGEERRWTFRPQSAWRAEPYTLVADELLEDLAGNTPDRVFDADLAQPDTGPATLARTFEPTR